MSQPKILIIDDELGIREGTKRALTPQGFSVDTAEDGDQGLRKIEANPYDLVLLDVMMPGFSGIDLLSYIRRHDPDLVCIIITGYATVELAVRAIKQGAYDFLTKPFSVDDLMLAVNQGLERRRLSLETKRLQAIEAEARRLTEEKARLEEVDRAKMRFVRLVTHELQAPVAAIDNYLQLMLEGYVPPEKERETLDKCRVRAQEEMALIADLLELGKVQAVGVRATAPVHLDDVLRQVAGQLGDQAAQKGLQFSVDVAGEIPPVQGVADQFKSVWANLIGNAIKYTLAGAVQVSLRHCEGKVVGQVSDTGIGIPPEARDRLFTEFFRADNAKAMELRGTGLGLAIVKQVIEGAGGKIWVESEPGHGSTFTFELPAATDAPSR